MHKSSPRVSVVITCHDLGSYLIEAIDSVLQQTLQELEVIVVDDASTDKVTLDILGRLDAPKTRVIRVEKRLASAARNIGIREAKGLYVCCLDADDLLEAGFLGKAAGILDKDPDAGFVGCWYEAFGEDTWCFKPEECGLVDFLIENRTHTASVFRKRAWEEVGGYDERLKGYEDWELWINLLAHGYGYRVIREVLFRYRVRKDSKIKESNLPENRDALMRMIIEKHSDVFREYSTEVMLGKERLMSSLLKYQRELLQAQEWYKSRDRDHEKHVQELKEWSSRQLESYKSALAEREAELARQRDEIISQDAEIHRLNECIQAKEHELRSIYASKVWKLGCAFRDAKHSVGAALMLPLRVADFACPNSIKRGVKRLFFVEPHEVIKKNVHKFPYRLADRLLPKTLKKAVPYKLRNMARALFRTTDERLCKLEEWNGPLVTVVIPCYNYGRYLDEALQSVRNQTFSNYEVIIVDDGSTESLTIDKLKEIEERKIPGVRVIHQANAGVSRARNHAIAESRGKYICCLDADDILEPTYLEKCLLVLEGNNLDLCYTHVQLFGDESWVWKTSTFDVRSMLHGNCVSTSAVFKKSCWKRAGGYRANMHHGWEDWDFWLSVAEIGGRGAVIPEPLFRYRRHGETRDVKAAADHAVLLLEQICKNHPELFSKQLAPTRELRYKVTNPLVNIHRHGGKGVTHKAGESVLFLLPWMVMGGADSILLGLVESLAAQGEKQIHIITTVKPPLSMGDSTGDFLKATPYIYKLPGLLDEAFWYDYIEEYIRSRDIRTVFICGASYIYPYLPRIKKAFPYVRIVDQIFNDSEMGHIGNNRVYADYIDLTFVVSDKIRSSIISKYGGDPEKLKTIYHGIDIDRFDPGLVSELEARQRIRLPADKRIILFVGRLSREKNPRLFLELAKILESKNDLLFVMAGDGPMLEEIKTDARKMGLKNVLFPGMVQTEDMPYLYRLASLLVVTSHVEGIPLTIFEALAMNVPVVSSVVGGIEDVVLDGKNGFLCRSGTREQFAEKIEQSLAIDFGETRDTIHDRHLLRNIYSEYLKVFDPKAGRGT